MSTSLLARTHGAADSVPERARRAVETPRVSLIIPTLDEAKCLRPLLERVDRAVRSTHGLEVIVSDGGSTDDTLAIADELADEVVRHTDDRPQTIAAGRNAGAGSARGRLLIFVNADVAFPDDIDGFLAEMLRAAEHHGAATCRVEVHPAYARLRDKVILGACNASYYAWTRMGLGMGRGECHVVRRDVFDALGGYNTSLVAGEDFDLYRRIAKWGRRTGRARIAFLWRRVIWEDPRRYRKHGYARTLGTWLRNSIYVSFLGRAHSDTWDPVR